VSHPRIKPRALKPGDTVGVVSPASAIDREHLERGVAALKRLGFRVKVSRHALDRDAIVAGSDEVRARELQAFFADPEVDAIFAARGGYGAGRILPLLDFAAIARTPKVFMGFSDATFLLNALVGRAGMVCFHGPMVAMDFARGLGESSLDHLRRLLGGGEGRRGEQQIRDDPRSHVRPPDPTRHPPPTVVGSITDRMPRNPVCRKPALLRVPLPI